MSVRIIGIDLGTTNSCVAFLEGGEAAVIPNDEGGRTTPSIFAVGDDGSRLVGMQAKRQAVTNPEHTVTGVKRMIGSKYDAAEIQNHAKSLPYRVIAHENGDAWVHVRDQKMSPAEVSAEILKRLKAAADDYLGEDTKLAVITVPAHFNDAQRQATKDAGRIAGLDVQRIINEPTAAALAYGLDRGTETLTIAVYDLGGGTFDISILELNNGVFDVKSTNGDTFLGGEDFDQRIMKYILEVFTTETGVDLVQNKSALQRVREAAEKAKHELSSATMTNINLPFIAVGKDGPLHFTTSLTRQKLEELTYDLVEKSLGPCGQALKDAGVNKSELSEVILVGGMTRMPLVKKRVTEFFGREANNSINPDEVVAIGAAVQGGVLSGATKGVVLIDVTPLTLGVETAGGIATPMIPKNSNIPCKVSTVFSTSIDDQPSVPIHVIQGERPMAKDNKTLAQIELTGIQPAPRGGPQIEVTFDINANGIVNVSAKDLVTGKAQSIEITTSSGLSEEEIVKLVHDAETNRTKDLELRAVALAKSDAEGLIYTTERSMETLTSEGSEQDMIDAVALLEELQDSLETNDVVIIREAIRRLENVSHKLTSALYAEASAALGGND